MAAEPGRPEADRPADQIDGDRREPERLARVAVLGRAEQPSSYFGEHRPGRLDGIGCDPMNEPMSEPMRDSTSDAMSESASAAAKIAGGVATDAAASGNNHEAASHPADAPAEVTAAND